MKNAAQPSDVEPCMECHSCKQAMTKNQPDIIYVRHEKPNTISVDDIRTQVNNDIVIKPYSSRYKIYIIDEAEKMNEQAQNALLKTIEEPPAYAILILLTTNAAAFLPTILSRCVTLNIKAVPDEKIRELERDFSFELNAKVDETHTAVRFVTSWATSQETLEALVRAL